MLDTNQSNEIIKALHPLKRLNYESQKALSDIAILLCRGDLDIDLIKVLLSTFSLDDEVSESFIVFINSLVCRKVSEQKCAENELIEILLSSSSFNRSLTQEEV
jgi:hypothetical protein